MNLFSKKAVAERPADHRADAKVVASEKRIAELKEIIKQAEYRAQQHDPAIEAAAKVVERRELEVLAGVSGDADLAVAQAAHIAARREKALDLIEREKAAEELAKLSESLPALKRKAARASQKAYRKAYLALALEEQAALQAVIELDGRLAALAYAASQDHPIALSGLDHELPPSAGLAAPTKTTVNPLSREMGWTTPRGQSTDWLANLERAIEQVRRLQGELD